jgi:glutamate dehydrogenase/leucine dehydrogenase
VDEYRKKLKTKSLKLKANEILATFTGKPAKIGGSLGRTEATGRGGVYILQELLAKLKSSKHEARNSKQVRNSNVSTSKRFGFRISDFGFPQSIRIAVQGMGNVGYYFAKLAREQGFRIVALSDSKGGIIVNEKLKTKNLRIDEVMKWKKKTGSVVGFPGTTQITNDELLTTDCDILVPSALESVISEKNAGEIRAKVIIEMANGPVTPEADEILAKRGVFLVPDILANSGGVTVSYFEWLQNLKKQKWAEEKVNLELKKNLTQVFDDAWQISKKHGVDLRIAAYILAVDRIIKGE